jgi:putative two-component system response regulator
VAGLDISSTFLDVACQIAMSHHEKWDGSGYPAGLSGDSIPIPARLMALADVYDAMSCRRVYKSAIAHEEVTSVIVEGRGKHFDPDVVDAYLEIQYQFVEIAAKYRD